MHAQWTRGWTEFDPQNKDYSCGDEVTAAEKPVSSSQGSLLSQNYPNPFNPQTSIDYTVPAQGLVKLEIFNVSGQLVRTLVNDTKNAGTYTVRLDATGLTSGLYFYRMTAGEITETRKMVLMK